MYEYIYLSLWHHKQSCIAPVVNVKDDILKRKLAKLPLEIRPIQCFKDEVPISQISLQEALCYLMLDVQGQTNSTSVLEQGV
jgi:hypothetical protein